MVLPGTLWVRFEKYAQLLHTIPKKYLEDGMQDKESFSQLLGLKEPWKVVEMKVDIWGHYPSKS